jgi:hypothetical protein
MAVMNVTIFWNIPLCSPYVNYCFGGMYHLHLQGQKSAGQQTSKQQVARQTQEDEGDTFLPNAGSYMECMALYPKRW